MGRKDLIEGKHLGRKHWGGNHMVDGNIWGRKDLIEGKHWGKEFIVGGMKTYGGRKRFGRMKLHREEGTLNVSW